MIKIFRVFMSAYRMQSMLKRLGRFCGDDSGSVAIITGILMTFLLIAIGVAVDFGRGVHTNHSMQDAVDAAALAAAGMDGKATQSDQKAFATAFFAENYTKKFTGTVTPLVSFGDETVTVVAATDMPTTFMQVAKTDKVAVSVTATAWRGPRDPICVLSLDPSGRASFNIHGTAELKLENCAGQANSNHSAALNQAGNSSATADSFCSHGGYGGNNFYDKKPYKNCSRVKDPFKDLEVPTTYGCDHTNAVYKKKTFVLTPGTYCGGIEIGAHADVTFSQGLYIIKDGEFRFTAHSVAKGFDVTFYLIGNNAKLRILSGSDVDLVAPASGDYAGILFAQDPASNPGATNLIAGGADIKLVGAIYFPTQILSVTSTSSFGANSPFMPLIAWQIDFSGTSDTTIRFDPSLLGGNFDFPMPTTRPQPRLLN
jgi:Flp pilus assembly protein TadG